MKVFAHFPQMRDRWLKKPIGSQHYRHWLSERGSLTLRLQRHSRKFAVQPVRQTRAKPPFHEAQMLYALPRQHSLLRDVILRCDGEAVVFAHSVLPRQAMRGAWRGLGRLGNHSLGSALFADPRMCRDELQYKKLSPRHFLYRLAAAHIPQLYGPVWARRSVFRLHQGAVLVTELFLPAVLALPEADNKALQPSVNK